MEVSFVKSFAIKRKISIPYIPFIPFKSGDSKAPMVLHRAALAGLRRKEKKE